MRYITLTSNRNADLLTLLNNPEYADYKVLVILPVGSEYTAYLEKEIKTPVEMGLVSPPAPQANPAEPILLKTRKKNEHK
jgi:hypothetical protein